ncbi:MFS transporter [Kitasatospora paracochleata]
MTGKPVPTVVRRRLTLACSVTGAALVAMDGTVLTVVQPSLQRDLHATLAQVQWTGTGYLIAVAGLLVLAGRLGDLYGHGRLLTLGALGFGATSAGIGLAPGIGWVIALRVAQGVFGALLQPATLGMLRAAYPPDRLGPPIALRTSAIGLAAATGPLLGGALAAHLGWRAVFFLGIAPALLVAVLGRAAGSGRTDGPRPVPGGRPDLAGAGLLAFALVCLVHALVELPRDGWTAATGPVLAVGLAAGAGFGWHQRRTEHPLVPPRVVRSAPVALSLGILVAVSAALLGALFLATWFLQDVQGLDPLRSSMRGLPLAVMMVLGAPAAAWLLRRTGARWTASGGVVLLALGVALLSRLDAGSSAVAVGTCFASAGAGYVAVMVTATAVVVRHAAAEDAGVAGGLKQTALNIGPVLGVAAATMLVGLDPGGGFVHAMRPALAALAALAVLALPAALRLPGARA